MKTRIIRFKNESGQDVWLAQKKGWFGWKPLHWTAPWHHCIENAQEEINKRIREEYIKKLPKYDVIDYPPR